MQAYTHICATNMQYLLSVKMLKYHAHTRMVNTTVFLMLLLTLLHLLWPGPFSPTPSLSLSLSLSFFVFCPLLGFVLVFSFGLCGVFSPCKHIHDYCCRCSGRVSCLSSLLVFGFFFNCVKCYYCMHMYYVV